MKTFSITTLGCRVNHYEGEQLAALCRARGLTPAPADRADLRIVHTCSVTVQAASKSRQSVRRTVRLNVLDAPAACPTRAGETSPDAASHVAQAADYPSNENASSDITPARRPKVVVTGCWATSHPTDAAGLPGVDAVLGHDRDVAGELGRLLDHWRDAAPVAATAADITSHEPPESGRQPRSETRTRSTRPESGFEEGWMTQKAGTRGVPTTHDNQPHRPNPVKEKLDLDENPCEASHDVPRVSPADVTPAGCATPFTGTTTLPQLAERQSAHQRAFLKVQDGCDAHCTYCIIPKLRPRLWSRPIADAVDEARRLTDAGHAELVLTGIFLGAYDQPTALHRRQGPSAAATGLGRLVDALCTAVPNLRRLRLSSLEPADLTPDLLAVLRSHAQVVPHFHLPLQSGSDPILRRMNRQYTRDDFLRMADRVRAAFDRPAITTDVIVGFPGETDHEFAATLDVVDRVRFIHTHAFSYSPRPQTAAARWTKDFARGPIVNDRIDALRARAAEHSLEFRRQFVGETAEVLVEHPDEPDAPAPTPVLAGLGAPGDEPPPTRDPRPPRHGRCERYFPIHFRADLNPGAAARVRITRVTPDQTFGELA